MEIVKFRIANAWAILEVIFAKSHFLCVLRKQSELSMLSMGPDSTTQLLPQVPMHSSTRAVLVLPTL